MCEIFVNQNNEKYQCPLLSSLSLRPFSSSSSFSSFPLFLLQPHVTFIPVWGPLSVSRGPTGLSRALLMDDLPTASDGVRKGSWGPWPLWAPGVKSSPLQVVSSLAIIPGMFIKESCLISQFYAVKGGIVFLGVDEVFQASLRQDSTSRRRSGKRGLPTLVLLTQSVV